LAASHITKKHDGRRVTTAANPKIEKRNSKQIRNSKTNKIRNKKVASSSFGFGASSSFRMSDFVLRISAAA